jgi:hypothetical protein
METLLRWDRRFRKRMARKGLETVAEELLASGRITADMPLEMLWDILNAEAQTVTPDRASDVR